MRTRRASKGFSSKTPAWGRGKALWAEAFREAGSGATEMTLRRTNRAGRALTVFGSAVLEGLGRGGGESVFPDPWAPATPHPCRHPKMMGCEEPELESVEGGEAVADPGPAPEPRAPVPGAPVPEPGLDLSLSLSPLSESPGRGRSNCSPGRRKGRADRRGGARKGRQVSWGKAWPPARRRPRAHLFTAPLSASRSASAWRRPPRYGPSRRRPPPHRARSSRRRRTWGRPRSRAAWP